MKFIIKKKGSEKRASKVNIKNIITVLIGGFITINLLLLLTNLTSAEWFMVPFGASCVLATFVWKSPLSQPRNIVGGHFISTFVGLATYNYFGDEPCSIGLAVGLAIALMMITKTTHPPAGADPFIVILGAYNWSYLLTSVLIGSLLIVISALIINNLRSDRSYPTFWL